MTEPSEQASWTSADSLETPGSTPPGSIFAPAQNTPVAMSVSQEYPLGESLLSTEREPRSKKAYTLGSGMPAKRKAALISSVITLVLILGSSSVFLFKIRQTDNYRNSLITSLASQDAKLTDDTNAPKPVTLEGTDNSLLVNGDIVNKGTLRFVDDDFSATIVSTTLSQNQTYTLPDASGTICLDSNNCNYATTSQVQQLQTQVNDSTTLNDLAGDITLQGTANQINVSTGSGTITLSTPQNIAVSSSPTFAGLTLSGNLSVAGTVTLPLICTGQVNGGTLTTNGSGQVICADDDGGGTGDILQGGNSFGTTVTIGTNDGNALAFETAGTERWQITTSGVLQASGAQSITTSSGDLSLRPAGNLVVGTSDTTGTLLVVDTKTDSSDPAGVAGGIYYNSNSGKFRCYQNGGWIDCVSNAVATKIVAASNSANKQKADYVAAGSNSDEDAINSAIASLPIGVGGSGGIVYLLEGTFIIDGSISIPNNVMLVGAGPNTIIKLRDSHNADLNMIINSDITNGNTRIAIRNLRLDGNSANQTAGSMSVIYFRKIGSSSGSSAVPGVDISGIEVANMRCGSIILEDVLHSNVSGNTILNGNDGSTCEGIEILNNTLTSKNVVISNNRLISTRGIDVRGENISITGNSIADTTATGTGILVSSSSAYVTISGNSIKDSGFLGIDIASASYVDVVGNTVIGCGNDCIRSNSSSNNLIASNIVHNAGTSTTSRHGINLMISGSNNTVTGNTITDTAGTGYAIEIAAAITNTYLADNRYSGTGASSINDLSSNTIYGGQLTGNDDFILQAPNEIGIGLTSPTAKLHVQATCAGACTQEALIVNNSTSTGNIAVFQDNGTAVFTIQDGGTVILTTLGVAGSTPLCLNVSNQFSSCSVGAGADTLQSAYNNDVNGSSVIIATTDADGDIIFNLHDSSAADPNFTVNIQGTTNQFRVQDGGTSFLTASDGRNLAFDPGNTGRLTITSDLSLGARSTQALFITQADNATNNSSTSLLNVTNSDTGSTTATFLVSQAATGEAARISTAAGGTGINILGVTSGTGLALNTNISGTGISMQNVTTGSGILFGGGGTGPLSSGTLINVTNTPAFMTTGSFFKATGSGSATLSSYSGSLIDIAPSRTHTGATTITDSGSYLNLIRNSTMSNGAGAYNVTGNVATIQGNYTASSGDINISGDTLNVSNSCTSGLGICSITGNVLEVNQLTGGSTGTVLNVLGAGTGNLATFDASNSVANGVSIDVQSSSSLQYALNITSNNGAITGLYVRADGKVGIGNTAPAQQLDVTGSIQASTSLLSPLLDTASAVALNIGTTNATTINLNKTTNITGDLLPNAASTNDLGSSTLEFDELYLGDNNGLKLGLDQDATLAYDEATDDRVELTGTNASLFIEDRLSLGVDSRIIADDGVGASPATLTLNPNSSYVAITCNDADGCNVTLDEAAPVKDGNLVFAINVSTNTVNWADTTGVSELAGAFGAGQYDSITVIYNSDRWVEISRSNN